MQAIPFMVRNKRFSVAQQLSALRSTYDSSLTNWKIFKDGFSWLFTVTPTAASDTYTLKLTYHLGYAPTVHVVSPNPLRLADGATRLPHTFKSKCNKKDPQHICLFYPKLREWNTSMLIAHTIVHWAIEWLYYYEIWAYTGKWLGEGHDNWDVKYPDDKNTIV